MQFSLKYYKPEVLIPVLLALVVGIDLLFVNYLEPLLDNHFPTISIFRVPSNTTLIAMIMAIHNKCLWHIPVLKYLVNVPDMRGRYSGIIRYEWGGEKEEKDCKIEVTQTASKISIRCYFNNDDDEMTSSRSLVEEIREEDGFYQIYFFYLNTGTVDDNKLDCHEGANIFKFIPANNDRKAKLIGNYFTNRQTQTRGIIKAEFESMELYGEF